MGRGRRERTLQGLREARFLLRSKQILDAAGVPNETLQLTLEALLDVKFDTAMKGAGPAKQAAAAQASADAKQAGSRPSAGALGQPGTKGAADAEKKQDRAAEADFKTDLATFDKGVKKISKDADASLGAATRAVKSMADEMTRTTMSKAGEKAAAKIKADIAAVYADVVKMLGEPGLAQIVTTGAALRATSDIFKTV
jgi:ribosomal protein L12E/L44/L45/RPP1/RPP2